DVAGSETVSSPGTRTDGTPFEGVCPTDIAILDQAFEFPQQNSAASTRHWQSFTAGISGELSRFDSKLNLTGSGTLRVYAGAGTGGTLLNAGQSVTLAGGLENHILDERVDVVEGEIYTVEIALDG